MCRSALHSFLQRLPKCEHHLHLEGALSTKTLFELAARNNIALPQDDEAFESAEALEARYQRFTSLDDFLHYYYIGMSVLIQASDFEALAWDYFQHASADGVKHAEVFFDPQAHTSRGIEYSTVLRGFQAACQRAEKELGISSLLITCYLRHLPVADSLSTFDNDRVQESYMDGSVTGIGIDSSEKDFPPAMFKDLYAKAAKQGLRLTAHAGEEGPASYISDALDTLKVSRIDHGIQLAHDTELMKRVTREKTMLTVCPMSNVVLRCVKQIEDVPIRTFLDAGVRFSINSDDPAYFGGYILENYCRVHEAFKLSVEEWEGVVRAGIEGSWCGDERKGELLADLEKVVKEQEGR